MDEPREIVAGDTIEWDKSVSGYSPDDGWTLTYYFWNETADFSVVATADSGSWTVTISAAVSADYTPGKYQWRAVVSKGEDEDLERYTVLEGFIYVRHDPAVGTGAGIDSRSAVKIALDAIDSVLAGTASKAQASYSIQGRALERRKAEELLVLRAHYARLYAKELRENRISQGLGGKRIYTRFG